MASDQPLRSPHLPTSSQVTELLEAEFARRGYDVEDVAVQPVSRPPRIVVVADGEENLDLEAVAELSRVASELLDAFESSSGEFDPYVLEVTSRGVDRPLTTERHYRRARGRKVALSMSDGSSLECRLGELVGDTVSVVVADSRRAKYEVRDIALSEIVKAVVQVEFSPPNRRELELAGHSGEEVDE
ncbi:MULTISPECIES: ribosome maturation factor RimP [unclassified Mycolicibacterium]|uniref:ribosome maturation factor RimP n=1 Tax=unclassified Mycolicibacterium TaxID=2636767 RepID=UPI001F4C1492|nr:ribosome maturation factor RimP [Mycolicibacterium sp. YH-1]UNB50320.1 ribosome maturation factor RimP [Mycolicibacterium sp. YH-1]